MRQVDGYCERLGPEYWAEPVNAWTNFAFLLAALIMGARTRGMVTGQVLSGLLFLIGLGSWAFHTLATVWAGIADVLPIVVFSFAYIFVANRDYWRMPAGWAALATAGFIPYAALLIPVLQTVPFLSISAQYWPLPLMILAYGLALLRRRADTGRGLIFGAGLLTLSLTARSLDMALCDSIPVGTHFLWHLLNALMLGWMIEVWRRHRLAHP